MIHWLALVFCGFAVGYVLGYVRARSRLLHDPLPWPEERFWILQTLQFLDDRERKDLEEQMREGDGRPLPFDPAHPPASSPLPEDRGR